MTTEAQDAEVARMSERQRVMEVQLDNLREKYVKSTVATEYLITTLSDRFDRHERHFSETLAKKVEELQDQVVRLKTLEEQRVRSETTGSHMSAERMGITEAKMEQSMLKHALKNNASLVAVIASLVAIASSLVQWFLKN